VNDDTLRQLVTARRAEKEQALFYRALARQAELEDNAPLAERLNGVLADEQHHLSRLTARLLELGYAVEDLSGTNAPPGELAGWEPVAREREHGEVVRYEALLGVELDDVTRGLLEDILNAERNHERELGGKWMMA
jgi:rubrerythrin